MEIGTEYNTCRVFRQEWRFEPDSRKEVVRKVDTALDGLPECSWLWIQLINRVEGGYYALGCCEGNSKSDMAAVMKQRIMSMPESDLAKLNGFNGVVIPVGV